MFYFITFFGAEISQQLSTHNLSVFLCSYTRFFCPNTRFFDGHVLLMKKYAFIWFFFISDDNFYWVSVSTYISLIVSHIVYTYVV